MELVDLKLAFFCDFGGEGLNDGTDVFDRKRVDFFNLGISVEYFFWDWEPSDVFIISVGVSHDDGGSWDQSSIPGWLTFFDIINLDKGADIPIGYFFEESGEILGENIVDNSLKVNVIDFTITVDCFLMKVVEFLSIPRKLIQDDPVDTGLVVGLGDRLV